MPTAGEILGLQWGDVDLLKGSLDIRRSVYQYHIGPAKTLYSEAALPLAPEVVSALGNWLTQAKYRSETDFIFPSARGGPRDAYKLREKVLQPAADRAGLGKVGWHSLRHSFGIGRGGGAHEGSSGVDAPLQHYDHDGRLHRDG